MHCFHPRRAGDDELRQQRVEGTGDGVADDITRVHPHARTARQPPLGDVPGRRQEPPTGVFSVDPELEGMTARCWIGAAQLLPVGDRELRADEIDAARLLRHRVLDLQPRVDLEERHGAVLADEELTGAGTDVPRRADDRLR